MHAFLGPNKLPVPMNWTTAVQHETVRYTRTRSRSQDGGTKTPGGMDTIFPMPMNTKIHEKWHIPN